MSRQTQYTWGGVLMGIGIPVIKFGVRSLLEWSPEETSWAEYRAMAEAETRRPVSYMGAALIAGIWIAGAVLIALMVASWQFY